jgi:hypothetical protein
MCYVNLHRRLLFPSPENIWYVIETKLSAILVSSNLTKKNETNWQSVMPLVSHQWGLFFFFFHISQFWIIELIWFCSTWWGEELPFVGYRLHVVELSGSLVCKWTFLTWSILVYQLCLKGYSISVENIHKYARKVCGIGLCRGVKNWGLCLGLSIEVGVPSIPFKSVICNWSKSNGKTGT